MKNNLAMFGSTMLLTATVFAASKSIMVSGAGIGTESDQASAHQSADSQAQNNLQNTCPGPMTSIRKVFDQCSQLNGTYVCNVNYTAICQVN
jgi:hypothetical protein